jgi:hypothetical protein
MPAHGLRKAGAVIAAENGATAHQLMSVFGCTTPERPSKSASHWMPCPSWCRTEQLENLIHRPLKSDTLPSNLLNL